MEELGCAAQLWLADSCCCHHTSEGMGKGKNLTGIACWGDLDEPAHPHLLGHLPALKPGCLEPPGSARSPCHALAPHAWAQTVTCCPQHLLLTIKPSLGASFLGALPRKSLYKLHGHSPRPALPHSSHETIKMVLVSSHIASVF